MNTDKQAIGEMAKDIKEILGRNLDKTNLYHWVTKDLYNIGYRKQSENTVEEFDDLLTEFDEMGFQPTTTVPDPEAYAIEWKNKLTNALKGYRKQSENMVAFPCKVGDTVFMIDDYDCEPYVIGVKVEYLKTDRFGEWVGLRYPLGIKYSPQIPIEDFGKKYFFTQEEAEAMMKGGAEG